MDDVVKWGIKALHVAIKGLKRVKKVVHICYGYAASMSYIIFVVIAIVAAIQFRLLRDNT